LKQHLLEKMKTWINGLLEGERDEFLGRDRHVPLDEDHDNRQNNVYVDIRGPETDTVERLVSISDMLNSGRLSPSSPIVRVAEANDISYIQIRGRHLIAPSPAIAHFLEHYVKENATEIRTLVDLFAGTAIATKIACRAGRPESITVVENDPIKLENSRLHFSDSRVKFVLADAMSYPFKKRINLVIADPYYEDVERFLNLQLGTMVLYVENLILIPGNVENATWNANMAAIVRDAGYRIREHALYGQVIFECKGSSALRAG